jgi:cysteine synthase A
VPEIFNRDIVDTIVRVTYEDARQAARMLAGREGILSGVSSGAILHAAMGVARELGAGKTVLAVLPDSGERYLSTELFAQ